MGSKPGAAALPGGTSRIILEDRRAIPNIWNRRFENCVEERRYMEGRVTADHLHGEREQAMCS